MAQRVLLLPHLQGLHGRQGIYSGEDQDSLSSVYFMLMDDTYTY